jgi:hypothetical protein
MKKLILRIVAMLFSLIIFGVAGGLIWLNSHEDETETAVLKALAAQLQTDAHIEKVTLDLWSDFPYVSLRLDHIWLMGSTGTSNDTLLRANEIQLRCSAWHLLQGEYQLKAVTISDAELMVRSNTQGAWNTAFWKEGDSKESGANFAIERLSLNRCKIDVDGTRVFVPEASISGTWQAPVLTYSIEGSVQELGFPSFEKSVPGFSLAMQGTWDRETGFLQANLSECQWMDAAWNGDIQLDDDGWACAGTFSQLPVMELAPWLDLPPPWNTFQTNALGSGDVSYDDGVFRAKTELNSMDWSIELNETETEPAAGTGEAAIWVKHEGEKWRVDFPKLRIVSPGIKWSGEVAAFNPMSGSFIATGKGELDFEMQDYLQNELVEGWPESGWGTWDGTVERNGRGIWSANGSWAAHEWMGQWAKKPWAMEATGIISTHVLEVQKFDFTWNNNPCTGSLNWEDALLYQAGDPIRASIAIHAEEWQLPASSDTSAIALTSLLLPRGSEIQWNLTADRVHSGSWTIDDVDAEGSLAALTWRLKRFRSKTLGGTLAGDGQVLFLPASNQAIIEWHPTIEHCSLPFLFQSFSNFNQSTLRSEHLQGEISVSGSLKFDWNHTVAWQPQTFEMLATVKIANGELRKLEAFENMANYLRENRMMAPLVDPDDLAKRLALVAFEPLESPVYISNQSVHVPDIQIRSSAMNISLNGVYRFDGALDYSVGFAMRDLRNSREDEFGKIEDDGLGHQFFIAMGGTVDEPKYSWDRTAQREHRKSNFQREKDLLRSLFNRH